MQQPVQILKIMAFGLFLAPATPLFGQFNTVSTTRKVTAITVTGEITPGTTSLTQDGKILSKTPEKITGEPVLENINHQKTGVAAPAAEAPAVTPAASAKADSTATAPPSVKLLSPPLDKLVVTSPYGMRTDPFSGKRKMHYGTDFRTASQPVYAMMPGKIKKIGYNKMLGNYIELEHGDFDVVYAHLHTITGHKGDMVKAGQSIGISGSTGRSTGDHLHVAMRYKNKSIDPFPLINYINKYSHGIPPHLPLSEPAPVSAALPGDRAIQK